MRKISTGLQFKCTSNSPNAPVNRYNITIKYSSKTYLNNKRNLLACALLITENTQWPNATAIFIHYVVNFGYIISRQKNSPFQFSSAPKKGKFILPID